LHNKVYLKIYFDQVKWTKLILLFFVVKSSSTFSQTTNPVFFGIKRTIDSLVLSIDKNQSVLVKQVIGADSLFGEYRGLIYYTTDLKRPHKINYDFLLDSLGSKIFYYNDELIKILDKGLPLYYMNGILLKSNGFVTDPVSTKNLLYFEATARKIFLQLFDKD
jgi:hypothetical protein